MVSENEAHEMLNEIADEIPQEFFAGLNGGVILSGEAKSHPQDVNGSLFILGQYVRDALMGRYIVLYYGSFANVYAHLPPESFRAQLKRVLLHEFTHHVESRAGEKGLEIKDAQWLAEHKRSKE